MTLSQFKKKFEALRKKGFVKTHRKGPTGVGHTLEQELGLTENNIAGPDFKFAELKAHRSSSGSLITLFTFNRKVWKIKPIDAVKRYGTPDENGRLGIYFTMGPTPNSAGLFLDFKDDELALRHRDGTSIATISVDEQIAMFNADFPNIILASADVESRVAFEFFHFSRARLVRGVSKASLFTAFRNGDMKYDVRLRLNEKSRGAENNRLLINECRLPEMFEYSEEL